MKQKSTVFVVDDDASVRKSLSRCFRLAGLQVEAFASAHDFLRREHFDGNGCLVLDIRMPGLSGTDLFGELLKADYNMPVVFLTGHGNIDTGVMAMKDGAFDFLTKPVDNEKITKIVRAALAKDAVDRDEYFEKTQIQQRLMALSDREVEVLSYVITGMLNKQIADVLKVSEITVKKHRGSVTAKLGVYSVAELVRFSQKAGVQPANGLDS